MAAGTAAGATGVVGFGGGSPMDVAKLAALLLGSGEDIDAAWGVGNAAGPRLPLALVPTTAGTGSEVTPVAIITVAGAEKRGVSSPLLLPDLALLDPDLTLGLPPSITAATGIDAMVHAIEAYASRSPNANPLSRMLAIEALRLLGGAIETAVRDGADRDARGSMLLGATLAGQAFANSPVAAVHALAYPIGGRHHVPHGLSNALVLPHVLRFNAPAAAAEYAALAPHAFPGADPAPDLAEGLAALCARLGLPRAAARRGRAGGGPAGLRGRGDEADAASGEQPATGDRGRRAGDLPGGVVSPRPFVVRDLGEIAIRCADLDRMTAFYRDVLGLESMGAPREGVAFFRLAAGHAGHTRVLALFRADEDSPAVGLGSSLHHLALNVDAAAQAAAVDWLAGQGLATAGRDLRLGRLARRVPQRPRGQHGRAGRL